MLPEAPRSAEELMVLFARELCLVEQDRFSVAEQYVPADWAITRRSERLGVTYSIDAPIPRQDQLELEWRGRVGTAQMWLRVTKYDNEDPALRDHSMATFGVSPDTAVDLARFQQRLSMTMTPRFEAFVGGGHDGAVFGDFVLPAQPRTYGYLQHYLITAQQPNAQVQTTARHFYGEGYPEQLLDLSCSTAFVPIAG
jgi:hypothetical protein